MKQTSRQFYEAPAVQVVELRAEGVLAASTEGYTRSVNSYGEDDFTE